MGIFDATKLRPFASQYPGRNQNFIQTLDYNSDTGMYEINFSPHTGYNTYAQAPTWQMGGAASPHLNACPEGQVMGVDGICRIDPNYTGQPTFDTTTQTTTTPTEDITEAMTSTAEGGGAFDTTTVADDAYQRQEDLYKRVQTGAVGEASPGELANLRMDKYQTLPGGMKNWSESQLFQYALDRNFFTGDERLGISWKDYADQIPKPGEHRYAEYNNAIQSYFDKTMFGQIGQALSDKSFDDWVELATKKGIIEYDAKTKKYKILKGPGGNENALYAGGYLVPLDEYKQVEADYQQGYFAPFTPEPKISTNLGIDSMYDTLSNKDDGWWHNTMINAIQGNYKYLDEERYDNNYPDNMKILGQDYDLGESISYWTPSSLQIQPDLFTIGGQAVQDYKNDILALAKSWDTEIGSDTYFDRQDGKSLSVPDFLPTSDELLQGRVTDSEKSQMRNFYAELAGIPEENWDKYEIRGTPEYKMGRSERPQLFEIGTGTVYSATVDLSKPVSTIDMNYAQQNAVYGETAEEVVVMHGGIFNAEPRIDRVQEHDGSNNTTEGWGYNADGRFVNVNTRQTAAMGSLDDGIAAIESGTASSKLLDRFYWGNEKDGYTTKYNNKEEYMAAQDTKVMYRNHDGEQTVVDSDNYDAKDDNSKGKIICDYFYRKGLLSEKLWKADEAYGEELLKTEPDVMKGYHAWARHYVREMEKESLLGKIYFAWAKLWVPHWAKYLAGEKTIRGKILHSIGKPICNMIGKLNRRIKWQEA